jgi:hypothetical protein
MTDLHTAVEAFAESISFVSDDREPLTRSSQTFNQTPYEGSTVDDAIEDGQRAIPLFGW